MKRYILLVLAAVALAACTQSNINELQANRGDGDVLNTITVGFENDDTRIAVFSGKTKWSAGDLVSVFPRTAENQIWQFQGESGARTGDLKYYEGPLGPQVMDNIIVLYPHGEYILDVENKTVKSDFVSISNNIEDAFSGCTMVASSDDDDFTLKNTTGWLKLSLTGNGERVSYFVLRGNDGEQIGGNIEIDVESAKVWFDDDVESTPEKFGDYLYNAYAYYRDSSASDAVATLSSTPIEVHFELIPQTFAKGVTVEIYCEGCEPMVVSTENEVKIKRNHIQPMDTIEFNGSVDEEELKVMFYGMLGSLLSSTFNWEHTDFGYHSVGVYNDHACKLIACNGWMMGSTDFYNRFYPAQYGLGYSPNDGLTAHVWNLYYRAINYCNYIINMGSRSVSHSVTCGMAKSYRAMLYLDLARMFECLYAETDNSPNYEVEYINVQGFTVPIYDENSPSDSFDYPRRATRDEMFKFIFEDLADAEKALATYVPTVTGEPSLPVVYGLYARAYLWLGGFVDGLSCELPEGDDAYALAAEYARKAINSFGGAVMSESEWTNPYTGFNVMASSWMWGLQLTPETVINNLFQFTAHMSPEASYGYAPLSQPGVASSAYERLSDTDFRKNVVKGPNTTYEEFMPYTTMSEDQFYALAPYVNFKFRPANGESVDSGWSGY